MERRDKPCSKFEEDLFEKCFKQWGVESQLFMLVEECSELIQSASKDMYRNVPERTSKERLQHFAEEIADVQLMLDEFIWRFNLEEDVKYFRMEKRARLEKLLDKIRIEV